MGVGGGVEAKSLLLSDAQHFLLCPLLLCLIVIIARN